MCKVRSPLQSLKKLILKDTTLRMLAAQAIKADVDYIYGYPKYSLDVINRQLSERLECMEYLGFAVNSILNSKEVSEDVKVSIAKDYLSVVLIYSEGKLKSKHSHYWEDMTPVFVVETALFLNEKKVFNWGDVNVIRKIIYFARSSSVKAKANFLSVLVTKINEDKKLLDEFTKSAGELAEKPLLCLGKPSGLKESDLFDNLILSLSLRLDELNPKGLGNLPPESRTLLINLFPLLDADYSSSSVEPLVKLKALSNQDLISLFIAQVSPLRLNPLNRVVFYRNFAKAMFKERGIKPSELVDAIDRSIESSEDFPGFYEQKILGLMDATEEIGEGAKSLAEVVKKCLEYRMETDTRFRFLKFAYKYTKDEEILKKALNCKSKKIRSWAMKEMENLR
ncbi:MAG: hypothetical protein ACPLRT_07640 [Thermoproteota archaeon]